jgi:hypothetical protein
MTIETMTEDWQKEEWEFENDCIRIGYGIHSSKGITDTIQNEKQK